MNLVLVLNTSKSGREAKSKQDEEATKAVNEMNGKIINGKFFFSADAMRRWLGEPEH